MFLYPIMTVMLDEDWTLDVSRCSLLTDSGFQSLTRSCHDLEKMDLEECLQITDATLGHIATYCHHLSALSLSHCELITDEGIRQIGSSPCATEQLQVVELDNCPLITDASLEHLMGCQSLKRIEIYDCQLITRAGIRRLRILRKYLEAKPDKGWTGKHGNGILTMRVMAKPISAM